MSRVQRVFGGEFYPRALCLHTFPVDHSVEHLRGTSCTWDHPVSLNTREQAKAHTKETGHRTRVIREAVDEYERRD